MKHLIYGIFYSITLCYVLVICSEMTEGILFSGLREKLFFIPFTEFLTKQNIQEFIYLVNRLNLIDLHTIKMLSVGMGIFFAFGVIISKYLIAPKTESLA